MAVEKKKAEEVKLEYELRPLPYLDVADKCCEIWNNTTRQLLIIQQCVPQFFGKNELEVDEVIQFTFLGFIIARFIPFLSKEDESLKKIIEFCYPRLVQALKESEISEGDEQVKPSHTLSILGGQFLHFSCSPDIYDLVEDKVISQPNRVIVEIRMIGIRQFVELILKPTIFSKKEEKSTKLKEMNVKDIREMFTRLRNK